MRQLLSLALEEGRSIKAILHRVGEALDGIYSAGRYDERDLDIGLFVYRTGGSRLVYALNHAGDLPSLRTLTSRMTFTPLLCSVGIPQMTEVIANIRSTFSNINIPSGRPRCGHVLMLDEISINEKAVYIRHNNSIGGLCREHTSNMALSMTSVEAVERIADAVHGEHPTVHYGREATVGAISPLRDEDYTAKPILISPTCHGETPAGAISMTTMLLECWKQTAEAVHGPVWTVASDGDATRRAAAYSMFMKETLDPSSPLGKILYQLAGLNYLTGPCDITFDFDAKHLFKHPLRSSS